MEVLLEKKESLKKEKKSVAWGITGSGDRLVEIVEVMKRATRQFKEVVDVNVFLSKAGDQVVKYYRLEEALKEAFSKIWVEVDANSPFLAGQLQTGKYEFLLIAPATSNTVAKISMGIADTLLSNAAIMGLKAFVPAYIMPSDVKEGVTTTKLPDGRDLRLQIRREDVENVEKLESMEGVYILEEPGDIIQVFKKHFQLQG